jgi:sec-independent protein translocase protein TatA
MAADKAPRVVQCGRSFAVGSLGLPELLVILFIIILIFGSNKLPQLGRGVGSAIKNFKEGMNDETPPKS